MQVKTSNYLSQFLLTNGVRFRGRMNKVKKSIHPITLDFEWMESARFVFRGS
jgi:hypothetical protein